VIHRWARLLKQQLSITVYFAKFHFAFQFVANKRKLAIFVFNCSKQTEVAVFRKFHFQYTYTENGTIYIYCCFKRKTEAQAIFLNPFTACLSYKRKFVVCPFVGEGTNGSYHFANRLNGLKRICPYMVIDQ
jgi:hypothetical protein